MELQKKSLMFVVFVIKKASWKYKSSPSHKIASMATLLKFHLLF